MALSLKLTQGAVDASLKFFYMLDTTGVYNVATNPTGYETPNPARTYFAVYTYGYRYVSGGTDTALTLDNTLPLTVTQWSVTLNSDDGYRYFSMLSIPRFGYLTIGSPGSVNYITGNIVYLASNSKYYICVTADTQAGGPLVNPSRWIEITDLTTIIAGLTAGTLLGITTSLVISGIYYTQTNVLIEYFNTQALQTQMFLEAKCNCNDVNFKDSNTSNRAEVRPYMRIMSQLYVASTLAAQGNYNMADDVLASLTEYTISLSCAVC